MASVRTASAAPKAAPTAPARPARASLGTARSVKGGACHPRHVGRYGGLAKHHLTPEEKAALASADYGATQPAGPPTGAVAYPYYTTRGPRDFLATCPPSIGPQ